MMEESMLCGPTASHKLDHATLGQAVASLESLDESKGVTSVDSRGNENFISYACMIKNARLVLANLNSHGISCGDMLVLQIDSHIPFYTTFIACILGGIVSVPLIKPKKSVGPCVILTKIRKVLDELSYPKIVIEKSSCNIYAEISKNCNDAEVQTLIYDNLVGHTSMSATIPSQSACENIFIQYSSGSTGSPKGVVLTHENILTNVHAAISSWGLTSSDAIFSWLPHTHDMGMFCQFMPAFISGANFFQFSPFSFIKSPVTFLKKISLHKGTSFGCPNFGYALMVERVSDKDIKCIDLSSLRFTLNAAEPISPRVIHDFCKKFRPCGYREWMMMPAYGLAEATVLVTSCALNTMPNIDSYSSSSLSFKKNEPNINIKSKSREYISVGAPVSGVSIRIVDSNGNVLPCSRVGEVQVRGLSVTSGYFSCSKNLFMDGWLCTGDIGFVKNKLLYVTSRQKDIVIINGSNYFCPDLEEVIYKQDLVKRGSIVAVGCYSHTYKHEVLVFFVRGHGSRFTELLSAINALVLSEFGIQVRSLINISSFPRTTSGKVKRYLLREMYENNQIPAEDMVSMSQTDYALSQVSYFSESGSRSRTLNYDNTKLYTLIQTVWSTILNLSPRSIPYDVSFSTLGGTSVHAFQMLGCLEESLKINLDHDILIKCSTIEQIVAFLTHKQSQTEQFIDDSTSSFVKSSTDNIAITGMAIRLPGASTPDEFWSNLKSSIDSIIAVDSNRRELSSCSNWHGWIGAIDNIECFDHEFFDMTLKEAAHTDPLQRIALQVCYHALEDANMQPGIETPRNIGVYAGCSSSSYKDLLVKMSSNGSDLHSNMLIGNISNMVAARISHTFNFIGPSYAIDTACSSSLVAMHNATKAIQSGEVSGAVVIGGSLLVSQDIVRLSRNAGIVSSSRYTKVFDKNADGSVLGEGVVVLYLEPLSVANQVGKHVYAVVTGSAVNNDGTSFSMMAPRPSGQEQVIKKAQQDAGVNPRDIGYLELHGTGTKIGDPIEMSVLSKIFNQNENKHKPNKVYVGSVKSNIGHLLHAAGLASVAKVLLCINNKSLVPNISITNTNPNLQLESSPFTLVEKNVSWPCSDKAGRVAGVSSFGLGGTNAHIILEEYIYNAKKASEARGWYILVFSGKSRESMLNSRHDNMRIIKELGFDSLHNYAYSLSRGRCHYRFRSVILANDYRGAVEFSKPFCIPYPLVGAECFEFNLDLNIHYLANHKHALNSKRSSCYGLLFTILSCLLIVKKTLANAMILRINNTIINHDSTNAGSILEDFFASNNSEGYSNPHNVSLPCDDDCENIVRFNIVPDARCLVITNPLLAQDCVINEQDCRDTTYVSSLLVALLYIYGADQDWSMIYPDGSASFVNTANYKFTNRVCWIKKSEEVLQ